MHRLLQSFSGKRGGGGDSSESKKKKKKDEDGDSDESDGDDPDAVKYVPDELDDIKSSNIIPRGKRQAALRSGLARPTSSSSSRSGSSKSKQIDSDDEEADF